MLYIHTYIYIYISAQDNGLQRSLAEENLRMVKGLSVEG